MDIARVTVKVSEAWVLPYATLIVTTFPQAARVGLRK